jgi:glycosyltransferase involved in cell wall biosynthesis/SAM-dependent methyltransferase
MIDMKVDERQKWDDYYASMPLQKIDDMTQCFGRDLGEKIRELLPLDGTVLEAGCGAGWQSLVLAQESKLRLTLMDFSPKALGYAERLFAMHNQSANFVCQDVFAPGEAEYDMVFNAGVLEHYTLEEQVAFLRGMASRSRKYVLALVPNRMCYWYWVWRFHRSCRGEWPFGKEMPMSNLCEAFETAGLNFLGHWHAGGKWSEFFITDLKGIDDRLREEILTVHRSLVIPEKERSYLVAALGCKGEAPSVPACWEKSPESAGFSVDRLIASMSDALAVSVASEHRWKQTKTDLAEREERVAAQEGAQQSIQEGLQALAAENAKLLREMEERIQSADSTIELNALKRSRGYRVLTRLWRIQHWLAPNNSRRKKALEGVWRLGKRMRIRRKPPVAAPLPTTRSLAIQDIIGRIQSGKEAILFLPSIPWSADLFQRSHHLARAFAREGFVAIFDSKCDGPVQDDVDGFKEIEPNLFLYRGSKALLAKLPQATLWTLPYNYHLTSQYPAHFQTVYDWTDSLETFSSHGREFVEANHSRAMAEADVVAAASKTLFTKTLQTRPDAIYLPNGADYDHFGSEADMPDDPAIERFCTEGKPIAGYHGAFASWFNDALLEETARLRPDWNFLLIGPQIGGRLKGSRLLELPNVAWIGPRSYPRIPGYIKLFDVAMIPYQINEITREASPLKLYEYFSASKPIVATPIPECQAYSEVHEVFTAEEFSSALDLALKESKITDVFHHLRAIGRYNRWSERIKKAAESLVQVPAVATVQRRSPKDLAKGALRRGKRLVTNMFPADTARGQGVRSVVQKTRSMKKRMVLRPSGPDLGQILQENPDRKGIVIYPPFIDWSWMRQRPHQLMAQFAKAGYLSLFCSPMARSDCFRGFQRIEERLYVCDSLDSLYGLSDPILLTSWAGHRETVERFRSPLVIYDYLDDLSVTSDKGTTDQRKIEMHRKMAIRSEIVLATAKRLYEEMRQLRPDAILCPNGVDYDHFHLTAPPPVPPDIAKIVESGRPIIGYYGALARWFDYELFEYTAKVRHDFEFVLIGPNFDRSMSQQSLSQLPNVHWLGQKQYEELPAYLYYFTVATIPFVINQITKATSPVKLFEYMAGGKPIVTSDMPECREYPCVIIARNATEYADMLDEAVSRGHWESYRQSLDREAKSNTWEVRTRQILDQVERIASLKNARSA